MVFTPKIAEVIANLLKPWVLSDIQIVQCAQGDTLSCMFSVLSGDSTRYRYLRTTIHVKGRSAEGYITSMDVGLNQVRDYFTPPPVFRIGRSPKRLQRPRWYEAKPTGS